MNLFDPMNQRVSKLNFFDIQLIKAGNWFFALIIVKLIPDIMSIDAGWFVLLLILFSIKPFYAGWIRPLVNWFINHQSEQPNQPQKWLSFVDLQLIKAANWFFALIIVKLIPNIMSINAVWFVVLLILCSIKPFYVAWLKNDQHLLTG